MSFPASRTSDLSSALAAACDRLVSPNLDDRAERQAQAALIAALIVVPFPMAIAAWLLLPALIGVASTLCVMATFFALGWLGVLAVSATRSIRIVGTAMLAAGAAVIGSLTAVAGGVVSPVALLSLLLPVEAWLVGRSGRSILLGGTAATLAVALQIVPAAAFPAASGAAGWHWMIPALYAATLAIRWRPAAGQVDEGVSRVGLIGIERVVDGFALRLSGTGDVLEAGEACRHKLGVEPALIHGSGLFQRIHVGDRVAYLCALSDLRDAVGRAAARLRVRVARRDGSEGPDLFTAFNFEFSRADADEAGITAIGRPALETATASKAAMAFEVKADGAEVAKNRFLAAVSHELRTPLNSIIGFSEVLLHQTFGALANERQREYVELVRASGQHLLAVVNAILDVSKIESGTYATTPEPFRFIEAVDLCHAMLQPQAEQKSIGVSVRVPADIGEIHADRRAIQQILINLLSNALKFTPSHGSVSIGAKRVGSRLHFWVSDTGIGIAGEDLVRLGRPFAQVQNDYTRQFEGTGLGLALVRGLVALHHGTMAIDSSVGKGTTVTISLPARCGDAVGVTTQGQDGISHGTFRKAG